MAPADSNPLPQTADPLAKMPRDEALPALVDSHGGRLYQLALRFCGTPEEAEDLVQETFLNAWKAWDDFEGRSSPATWLYTIASRACQRFQRKRSGEPDALDSLDEPLPFGESRLSVVPSTDDGPLTARLRAEDIERAESAIAALPEAFRKPLVLKEIAGFPLNQIAEILDIPEATVKTRLHRARLRLKRALDEGLETAELPPPIYDREVCLDLLEAKQDALDRGAQFEFPDGVVCERCAAVFATLDFGGEACRALSVSGGELPAPLRRAIAERLR